MKFYYTLLNLLLSFALLAQNDSSLLLTPERLGERDIKFHDLSLQETSVISATRSLEEIDKQPFTVWVITSEEILRNGFVTLADVMRAAPGVRVSQPGNALEGETFMIRGLTGNQFVKIMINDVPIKPAIATGMPIGAQLPIRQAERIEVLYGPAGAIYGEEACAGVINIILKETERPVFTQADLSFGRFGYNSLDLMFGGKLGRDKNIFRYSIYGSSTIRENSDYFYDQAIFNTNNYLPFNLTPELYQLNENYRGANMREDSFARTNILPHESRMFGINMTWRGLHFTYHRFARIDRSALGFSPLAISYLNPSNRLAERMETFSLSFQRKRKNRITQNTFAFESYQINNTSTVSHIFDGLSAAEYQARYLPGSTAAQQKALLTEIANAYAVDDRFATANGVDVRIESRVTRSINTKLYFHAGTQIHGGLGSPLGTHYQFPLDVSIDGTYTPSFQQAVTPRTEGILDLNLFAQLEWRGKRLNVIGGCALNGALFQGIHTLPRIGFTYRIDSTFSIRANASTGLRHGSLYGAANSYLIYLDYPTGTISSLLQDDISAVKAELFYASELGLRYKDHGGRRIDILGFWQRADGLYRPGYMFPVMGQLPSFYYGYQNAPGMAHVIYGGQMIYRSEDKTLHEFSKVRKKTELSGKTEFYVQYTRGMERFGGQFPDSEVIYNQPKWTIQFRTFFKINQKGELMLAYTHQGESLSKYHIYKDFYQLKPRAGVLPRYNTWDLTLRAFLSKQFLVYCNIQNMFDKEHAGLDATGTPDDLLFNPQPGRFIRFGVNYNMN